MSYRSFRLAFVIVAALVLHARAPSAGPILEFFEARFDGVDGVTGLRWPTSVAVSLDGKNVYVASLSSSAVAVFRRDPATGGLTFVEAEFNRVGGVVGMSGPSGVVVSPDGRHVYVAASYEDAVAVFRRDAGSGALTFVEAEFDGVGGVDGLNWPEELAVSPDGKHVYVVSSWDNALAVFARDASTGALTFVEAEFDGIGGVDGLARVEALAISPDGGHVYAAGSSDSMVALFARDAANGRLTFSGSTEIFGSASGVAVSPEGSHVYVATSFSIYVFARSTGSGALTLVEEEPTTDIDGAKFPEAVLVSPGGDVVYAPSSFDDGLAVFRRDPATGKITFAEAHRDGLGGVDGLEGAVAVAASPDDAHVYVVSRDDDAVAVFWKSFPSELAAGNEAYFAQSYAAAEQYYSALIAADPSSAIAYNNRGLARCKQLEFAAARTDFDTAKRLDTSWVAPFLNQGKCLAMQSDLSGARAEFEDGLALDAGHVKLLYNLGWVEAEEGRYDAALTRYSAALSGDPAYVRAMVASGVALAEKGDHNSAVSAFYEAINTAPTGDLFAAISAYNLQLLRGSGVHFDSETAAQNYRDGLFDMRVGLFAQAADHLTIARGLAPAVPDVPWMLSWCRLRQLQSSAAASAYAAARPLMPALVIQSSKPAQLFIDGIFRGNTPQTAKVFSSGLDLAFRRSEGPQQRTVVAYADGTPGGNSPIGVTLLDVKKLSPFTAEVDSDRDWLGDAWELAAFGDLAEGPTGDSDRDGVDNLREYWANTDPGPGSEGPGRPRIRRHVRPR